MKNNKTKVITLSALIIAVIGLSIGFAAFASTLNISTSASVTPTNTFSVKFASSVTGANGEFTEFQVTPEVAVTSTSANGAMAGTPEIDNTNNPTIGNLSASFTSPGQSVTYTFYVVNDGNYDAYLTNLVFKNATGASSFKDCVSDTLSSNPATQSLVDNVCSNISFTMSVGSDSNIISSTTLTNHLLEKSHYELVTVTIAYQGDAYVDGAFKVNFGDIDLNYRTIDEPETVAPTPTPSIPEQVGTDDLIPTAAQLSEFSLLESGDNTKIYGALSEVVKYYVTEKEGEPKKSYVLIIYNNTYYIWNCDAGTAQYIGELYKGDFEAQKWYYTTDFSAWNEAPKESPISLNNFEPSEIKSEEYINRVIASFNQ